MTGILKGNGTSPVTAITGTAGYNTYWSDANTILPNSLSVLVVEDWELMSPAGRGVTLLYWCFRHGHLPELPVKQISGGAGAPS